MEIEVVEKMEILNIIHKIVVIIIIIIIESLFIIIIINKIVDKAWNIIKNGTQRLLSLFQKRELPAIESTELPPDEPIIPAPFVLEESESDESDEPFVLEESGSYLRDFDRQYTIRDRGWCGKFPVIFMDGVRELVTGRLEMTRETLVKMVLKCMMQRTNKATGEEISKEVSFYSGVELNRTDDIVDYIYGKMVGRIQERSANWKLKSIVSLELHTVGFIHLTRFSPLLFETMVD